MPDRVRLNKENMSITCDKVKHGDAMQFLQSHPKLSQATRLELMRAMAVLLLEIHLQNGYALDFKLENVGFILEDGTPRAVLLDYGAAEFEECTHEYTYLSPEEMKNRAKICNGTLEPEIKYRGDLFRLGLMFYSMYTGNGIAVNHQLTQKYGYIIYDRLRLYITSYVTDDIGMRELILNMLNMHVNPRDHSPVTLYLPDVIEQVEKK